MHIKRWLTAIVALPFLLLLIFRGGTFLFFLLIGSVSLIALWEYHRIVFHEYAESSTGNVSGSLRHETTGGPLSFCLLGYCSGTLLLWFAHNQAFSLMLCLFVVNFLVAGIISLFGFKSNPLIFATVAKQVVGLMYVPFCLSFLILIRNDPNGAWWICAVLFIIFAGDTGAYYVGSYLGRHKLCPALSPGKTIEGAIGGIAANLGVGAVLKSLFIASSGWGVSLLFFMSIGLVGQAGDLFESELKRSCKVKDSGGILPGHGGMLDRIDALLFAAPVSYLFQTFFL
jgi:phosphatidate cytidylyltransferase